jgi:hypothetical protein
MIRTKSNQYQTKMISKFTQLKILLSSMATSSSKQFKKIRSNRRKKQKKNFVNKKQWYQTLNTTILSQK